MIMHGPGAVPQVAQLGVVDPAEENDEGDGSDDKDEGQFSFGGRDIGDT